MDIRSSQDSSTRQVDSRNDARSRLDVRNHDARDAFSTMLDGMKGGSADETQKADAADKMRDLKDDHRDDREESSALPDFASLGLPPAVQPMVPQPVGGDSAMNKAADVDGNSASAAERSGAVKNDNAQNNATQRTEASDKADNSGTKDASDNGVKEAKFDQALANALNTTDATAATDGIDISAMLAADAGTPVNALINPATLQAMTQATGTQPATPAPERMVMMQTPPTAPAFRTEFADNIRMLAKDGIHCAEIRLNPADLGPIDVRIRMVDGRTDVSMTAITPEARAAIEQALPKLAEAFAAAGIQLGNTSIGQKNAQEQDNLFAGASRRGQAGGNDETEAVAARPLRSIPASRLVDLYA